MGVATLQLNKPLGHLLLSLSLQSSAVFHVCAAWRAFPFQVYFWEFEIPYHQLEICFKD